MTAQSAAIVPTDQAAAPRRPCSSASGPSSARSSPSGSAGRRPLVVAGVSIAGAVFMTLIPFIAEATGRGGRPAGLA